MSRGIKFNFVFHSTKFKAEDHLWSLAFFVYKTMLEHKEYVLLKY
jgi:hypothetical protein